MFYFTLGNLSPRFRSQLSSIYLVAIVRHKTLSSYGMDLILSPFIEDMKKLVSVVMATFTLMGLQRGVTIHMGWDLIYIIETTEPLII